jgi:hypothetical protein
MLDFVNEMIAFVIAHWTYGYIQNSHLFTFADFPNFSTILILTS